MWYCYNINSGYSIKLKEESWTFIHFTLKDFPPDNVSPIYLLTNVKPKEWGKIFPKTEMWNVTDKENQEYVIQK
jgi:hypothetical protein